MTENEYFSIDETLGDYTGVTLVFGDEQIWRRNKSRI